MLTLSCVQNVHKRLGIKSRLTPCTGVLMEAWTTLDSLTGCSYNGCEVTIEHGGVVKHVSRYAVRTTNSENFLRWIAQIHWDEREWFRRQKMNKFLVREMIGCSYHGCKLNIVETTDSVFIYHNAWGVVRTRNFTADELKKGRMLDILKWIDFIHVGERKWLAANMRFRS